MQRKELRQIILDNFDWDKEQIQRNTPYAKVTPDNVFNMLNAVSGRFKPCATHLLKRLATKPWYIHCTAHEGGSSPNAPWHITLRAQRKGIHLNCKKNADDRLYIYEITFDDPNEG